MSKRSFTMCYRLMLVTLSSSVALHLTISMNPRIIHAVGLVQLGLVAVSSILYYALAVQMARLAFKLKLELRWLWLFILLMAAPVGAILFYRKVVRATSFADMAVLVSRKSAGP